GPALTLIFGDHQRLGRHAPKDDPFQHGAVGFEQTVMLLVQLFDQSAVHGDGVLYNLRKSLSIVALRQRLDARQVGDDRGRLPERSDRVLRAATVDARLAADARVDHREQSGGHGHEPYPTLPDRGREASEVTHRPAADGYDTTAAVDLLPLQ